MTILQFKAFRVEYLSFKSIGYPYISISQGGKLKLKGNFKMNNLLSSNPIGRNQKCIFIAMGGTITIGDNVGISSSTIFCEKLVEIGDNVRIGGNTAIYDTDFHSLIYSDRIESIESRSKIKTSPVRINDNAFIGAHCTILKGVHIGKNSIIGAGSVVTKTIPTNEVWAGNPAKFIRKIQ